MKIDLFCTALSFFIALGVSFTSCGGKETRLEIAKEQSAKDSLDQINKQLHHDMDQMMAQHFSDQEIYLRELNDSIRSENERTDKEYQIYKKEQGRIKKEEERRRKEEERRREEEMGKGPRWLNGSWNITTQFQNPYTGEISLVKSSINIDWEEQFLTCITIQYPSNDRSSVIGRYTISNGAIHCKDSYWDIDEINHRIGFGGGKYYTK